MIRLPDELFYFAAVALLMAILASCASTPDEEFDPFEASDDDETDLLDRPRASDEERPSRTQPSSTSDEEETWFIIPEASDEPSRPVDATTDGWDLDDWRHFDDIEYVYRGQTQWQGPDDISFSAIVDSDDSHFFVLVDVTDDRVVESHPSSPVDGVRLALRDPQLDELLDALPAILRERLALDIETHYTITPDGSLYPTSDVVDVATARSDDGYRVEAAFPLEALTYVSEMPLGDIAFRIDVYDGDDPADSEPSTALSAIVDSDDEPGFAVTSTTGLLPSTAPRSAPPRADALGRWAQDNGQWSFESFEFISQRWSAVDDLDETAAQLPDIDQLPEPCSDPDNERRLVDAYDHRSGSHRVLLALCGTAASDGQCPTDASTQLVWTSLSKGGDDWNVDATHPVFSEPLDQCPTAAPDEQRRVHSFSFLPFDALGAQVWGIGYRSIDSGPRYRDDETTVRLVDPRSPDFTLLERQLQRQYASGREQILYDSRIYVTDLNDEEGLDLCEVENIREQYCDGFMDNCETVDRGHEVLTHVDLWDSDEHRFEDFLLSRHQHCRGSTDFDDIAPGFKIIVVGNRLGLLPTPNGQ